MKQELSFSKDGRLRLLIIVGTRPEVIRLSEVIKKCRRHFDCIFAHTGQNYDYTLNGIFFRDLELEDPDVYLDAVGDGLGETMGNIIARSYDLMREIEPEALLVLGDTNSCLSAIAAKRLHILSSTWKPAIAARTSACPRRPTAASSTLFPTSTSPIPSTLADPEGYRPASRAHVCDRTPMAEVLRANLDKIEASDVHARLGLEPKKYILLSAHREENIDTPENFESLFGAINGLAEDLPDADPLQLPPAQPQAP